MRISGMLAVQRHVMKWAVGAAEPLQSLTPTTAVPCMVRLVYVEGDRSKIQSVAYAVYVCTLKHSPPTTYHGQDSAHDGHTDSILIGAMFEK